MLPLFSLGSLQISTYPLIFGILFGLSYIFGKKLNDSRNENVNNYNFYFLGCFLSAWAGAKLLFLMTLNEELLSNAINNKNFRFGGGFVFYGGFIFGLLFTIAYGSYKKLYLKYFEFTIPVLVLCHAIGRLGCFLAGCCYGTHCDLPWAIDLHGGTRHPVQLYESVALLLLFIFLYRRFLQGKSVIWEYFFSYAFVRFTLEFFRGDSIRGVYAMGLSTSQLISLGLACVALVFVYRKSLAQHL